MSEFARLLVQGAAAVGLPSPTPEAVESLGRYAMELDKWNRRVNLVSRAPLAKIVEVHFLDSLTLLPVLAAHGWRAGQALLDVGSGAGFPGLALKAACPSMPVTLVEPREKRACFLRHVVRVLGLSGVRVLDERLDDGGRFAAVHGRYTWITSRALTSLPRFLRLVEGSRRTLAVIRRNLGFSLAYNAVVISVAMAGRMSPLLAAILMPLSSLVVVLNSYRARTFSGPAGPPDPPRRG